MTIKKKETPTISTEQMQKVLKQNETLLKRIEELEKKKEEAKPKSYEEQIKFFEVQQMIIAHLQKFQDKQGVIEEAAKLVKDKTDNGDFEAKVFTLSLTSVNGEKKTIFNISNPVIIGKTLESVLCEINTKIGSLKKELTL